MSLITTIEEIAKYVAIDENSSINNFQPYINEAEELYLKELLGDTFLQDLQTVYTTANGIIDDMPDAYKALFPKVQKVVSYYTLLLAIPHLTVTIGNMGLRETASQESSVSAPRWKEEKQQFYYLKNGDIQADLLLSYLEETASDSQFENWFNSPYNTKRSGGIVYNATIASKYISINKSRRIFLALRGKLSEIETRGISKLIGLQQYNELVQQIKDGTLSDKNKELILKLEPIISKRALYLQLPFMRVQIADNYIFLYSGSDDLFKLGQYASDADVKILRDQLMNGDYGFLADEQELKQYLLDNIDDYPLVKASGVYTSRPIPGPTWTTPEPDPGSKYLAI